jgi:hypothetical protein
MFAQARLPKQPLQQQVIQLKTPAKPAVSAHTVDQVTRQLEHIQKPSQQQTVTDMVDHKYTDVDRGRTVYSKYIDKQTGAQRIIKAQMPVTQQTVTQQTKAQMPVTQQTVTQQTFTQHTVTQQTVTQQTVTQHTVQASRQTSPGPVTHSQVVQQKRLEPRESIWSNGPDADEKDMTDMTNFFNLAYTKPKLTQAAEHTFNLAYTTPKLTQAAEQTRQPFMREDSVIDRRRCQINFVNSSQQQPYKFGAQATATETPQSQGNIPNFGKLDFDD